jgi:hypothetical protein
MLVWTGVIPSASYAPDASQFTMEVPACTSSGNFLVDHWQAYPLWATVHVRWAATGGAVFFYAESGGYQPIAEVGTNGTGSFHSNAQTFAFVALSAVPANGTSCPATVVSVNVSYAI